MYFKGAISGAMSSGESGLRSTLERGIELTGIVQLTREVIQTIILLLQCTLYLLLRMWNKNYGGISVFPRAEEQWRGRRK